MATTDAQKWNRLYQSGSHSNGRPAAVLIENRHLLPQNGRALDLACGMGANAIFLAQHGLDTCAWDISTVALDELKSSIPANLALITEQRDIVKHPPEPDSFDVIVVSHFLDRSIAPQLVQALRKNGLLFYQTFIKEKIGDSGPKNPAYRLAPNELLELFQPLRVILYREEGITGDTTRGFRNEAMFIGQKTA